ncbi:hypothetical protein [Deinococcus sp.]|uniref:hypothetical protein n=1 Tax=Deinococcus sp. TaxID=47478 RepID=UPI00260099CA|nr:hypothetical protein [Deinococcus sp.]
MRLSVPSLLTLAATLTASALAGGVGGAVLPADSLFQPGQTWRVTGRGSAGQPVSYSLSLGRAAASSRDHWSFAAGQGTLSYQPALGMALAVNVDPALFFVAARPYDYTVPVLLCLGLPDGKGLRGILISARSNAELQAQNSLIPASAVQHPPKTPDELLSAARTWGLKSGSCTIKRLK